MASIYRKQSLLTQKLKAMKNLILTISILFSLCSLSFAQGGGSIKGSVIDKKTREPMPFAEIYVEVGNTKVGAIADLNGRFVIKPLNAGTYNVHISFMGYREKVISGVNVTTGNIAFLDNIGLEIKGEILDIIEIVSYKDPLIPKEPNKVISRKAQLDRSPDKRNMPSVLRNMDSSIQVSDDGNDIIVRGSRSGESVCYVDGIKQRGMSNTLPGNAVGSVAVYSGGIPAKYGDVTGGVVIIESTGYFEILNQWKARNK